MLEPPNCGIPNSFDRDHYRLCRATFRGRKPMLEPGSQYPIKMAALVLCQLTLLALFVWNFQ